MEAAKKQLEYFDRKEPWYQTRYK